MRLWAFSQSNWLRTRYLFLLVVRPSVRRYRLLSSGRDDLFGTIDVISEILTINPNKEVEIDEDDSMEEDE